MLDDDLTAFLESGCAMIAGFLTPDGEPFASRAWGLEVVDAARGIVRVLLGEADVVRVDPLGAGSPALALTGTEVATLRSAQVKGRIERIDPPSADDLRRTERYCDEFFGAVERVDRFARALTARLTPADLLVATVQLDEVFDQTPGPQAGTRLAGAS